MVCSYSWCMTSRKEKAILAYCHILRLMNIQMSYIFKNSENLGLSYQIEGTSVMHKTNLVYLLCAKHRSVTIRGLHCSKHGPTLCADNPWIVQLLHNLWIACLTCVFGQLTIAEVCLV